MYRIVLCVAVWLCSSTSIAMASQLAVVSDATPHGPIFYPNDGKPSHPGVIVFHGSEGGGRAYNMLEAQRLATQGYAAMAYCYFNCLISQNDIMNPQHEFIDLPIDKPYEAFRWLKESLYTRGYKTAVMGSSKGAELTFLIAAISASEGLPGPDLIAAHAVTDSPEVGFSWNWGSKACWLPNPGGLDRWNPACGTPIPATQEGYRPPGQTSCWATPPTPLPSYTLYSWTWRGSHTHTTPHHPIPLELFTGPVFFTHGEQDTLWCVSKAQGMQRRLEAAGRHSEVHIFPGEGHVFSPAANTRRWHLLVDFLDRHMK